MGLSWPVIARDFPANLLWLLPPLLPDNKSFIDQACSTKIMGYWPRSFFSASLWTLTSSRSIDMQKNKFGQYSAILTSRLVNNSPYILTSS